MRALPHEERAEHDRADDERRRGSSVSLQPSMRRLDDAVEQHGRGRRSRAPRRPGRASGRVGSFDVGIRKTPGEQADDDDRDVHEEDRAPVEVLEQEAAGQRAEHDPRGRRSPAQTPIALPRSGPGNTLVMIDSVAGMMNAPPMPMNARVAMSCSDDARERRRASSRGRRSRARAAARRAVRTGHRGCRAVSSSPANTSV